MRYCRCTSDSAFVQVWIAGRTADELVTQPSPWLLHLNVLTIEAIFIAHTPSLHRRSCRCTAATACACTPGTSCCRISRVAPLMPAQTDCLFESVRYLGEQDVDPLYLAENREIVLDFVEQSLGVALRDDSFM